MYIQFEKFTGNNKMYKILIKKALVLGGLGLTLLVYLTRHYKRKELNEDNT
jgi:hypothetical protein